MADTTRFQQQLFGVCPVNGIAELGAINADSELEGFRAKWPAALFKLFDSNAIVWRIDVLEAATADQRAAAVAMIATWAYPPAPAEPVPPSISDRQFFQQLAIAGKITQDEALAAVKTGTIPAMLQAIIDAMPDAGNRFNAEMLLSGATVFLRAHPLTEALGEAQGMTSEEIDALFRAAAQL